ncbi:ABC transporter permease [Xanthocytophaga agilis]|uniref:FtsX-like permease family protein n=1 Tax=Xanthocytophaga agilis TaxID=3048010 RepID=A0AAE3UGU5_9BACT|nr:FtsX-like permease family protein [Xanthocytophaga agilis]MDJ1505348.1 FtsX-like permease family protein [Xanthocytophaga agilis]
MKAGINTQIAFTYLVSRRKQTALAALGITFGISMFIFMNSLISGNNDYFEKVTLSSTPHIRLYSENQMSSHAMLNNYLGTDKINLISNPKLVNADNRIYNPNSILHAIKGHKEIIAISPQVTANVICSNASIQKNGNVAGVDIIEQDKMFDITSTMITGTVEELQNTPDGSLIGNGMAKDLNLSKGDNITLTASNGTVRRLRITGIFQTTIKSIDNTRCYTNVSIAQQLLKKDRSYITDIYINIKNYTNAPAVGKQLEALIGYQVEDWQSANEQSIAARMIRDVIANSVVITILIVAGFGIYNILNMTIYEKIKEIAILKATGFSGKHVVAIFIQQALFIGFIGGILGIGLGWLISLVVSKFYIGLGNVLYLPIAFHLKHYLQGFSFGIITAFFAGYIPARKASQVDPVSIIRG